MQALTRRGSLTSVSGVLTPTLISRKLLVVATAFLIIILVLRFNINSKHGLSSLRFTLNSPRQGYYFPPLQYNASAISLEDLVPSPFSVKTNATDNSTHSDTNLDPYAYVFYATEKFYACSVLVNINRLRNTFNSSHRILILVKPDAIPDSILAAFETYDASVIPYEPPPIQLDYPYYADVLLKLVSFRLHEYVPSLHRAIVMDSDQLMLRNLDHLFYLPDVEVAAPRMYWGGGWTGLTSALMVIKPNDKTWETVKAVIDEPKNDAWFDMDMVNQLFGNTSLVLPGSYCSLNSHFQGIDIPGWYGGRVPEREKEWKSKTVMTDDVKAELDGIEAKKAKAKQKSGKGNEDREEEGEHVASMALTQYKEAVEVEELLERKERLSDLLRKVFEEEFMVLHFSNMGKPWQNTGASLRDNRPHAHPLLAETMETWRREASDVCPGFQGIEI